MQRFEESFQIDWCPGASSAEFKFQTHEQAAYFASQFLFATQFFSAKHFHNDAGNTKSQLRQIQEFRWIPVNHCSRCIEIDDEMNFFKEAKTSFRLMINAIGNNLNLDMGTVIRSVLRYGVNIKPEQFCFQNPTQSNTHEERNRVLFNDLLALIANRYSSPKINLDFVNIADSKTWLKPAEHLQVVQAIKGSSSYEIRWTPLSNQADFVFPTHQHLKNFLQRFFAATHLFVAKLNLSPAYDSRSVAKDFDLPDNAINGWIFVHILNEVLRQKKTSLSISVSMVGRDAEIDMIAILTSILTNVPYPRDDQFKFKRTWEGPDKELQNYRFQEMLNLITVLHNIDSGVQLKLVDLEGLKGSMAKEQYSQFLDQLRFLHSSKPEKYSYIDPSIFGAVEQPAKENPKREMPEEQRLGWAAVAPADDKRPKVWPEPQPAAALVQEQDRATAPVIPLQSAHEIRQRLMANTLPALLAKLSMSDNPDFLLRVEAGLAEFIVANNQPAQPAVAPDANAYYNPPGHSNN